MPSKSYVRIWHAVRDRAPLSFFYQGKYREALPVILGYSADGREALMAYQTGGETTSGRALPGWRCFYLAELRDIKARKGGWL